MEKEEKRTRAKIAARKKKKSYWCLKSEKKEKHKPTAEGEIASLAFSVRVFLGGNFHPNNNNNSFPSPVVI